MICMGKKCMKVDILEYKSPVYDERWSSERKAQFINKTVVHFTPESHDCFPGFITSTSYSQGGGFEIIGNIFENYDIVENDKWLTIYQKDFAYLL